LNSFTLLKLEEMLKFLKYFFIRNDGAATPGKTRLALKTGHPGLVLASPPTYFAIRLLAEAVE